MGKRVKNTKPSKLIVNNDTNSELLGKLYIDFTQYPRWTHSYSGHTFTNALKDKNEAAAIFYFLTNEFFSSIEKNINNILSNNQRNCHKITGEKRKLAVKIVKQIHGIKLDEDINLWQLASDCNKGIRIIGVITTDVIYNFYPLFIDHHHLLYPSQKYNQDDYSKYSFFPQKELN